VRLFGRSADPDTPDTLTTNLSKKVILSAAGLTAGVVVWLVVVNTLFTWAFHRAPDTSLSDKSLARANDSVREVMAYADSAGLEKAGESRAEYPAAIEVGPAGSGNAFTGGFSKKTANEPPVETKDDLGALIRARQAPPAIEFSLKGMINAGGEQLAIIKGPQGSKTLRVGDRVEDWTVSAISGAGVVLAQGSETRTIVWEAAK
jgi:hypothetical protein